MRDIQLSIPKFQKLIPKGNPKLHVEVLTGKEEFIRRIFTLVDSAARTDGILRMIADVRDVDAYAVMGSSYLEYKKYLKIKKVKKRLIAPESSITTEYKSKLVKEVGSDLRISQITSSMPTAICFTTEVVMFDIFSEEVVSLMVWNSTISKSFTSHFDTLWKMAVPYKQYLLNLKRP